MIERRFFGKDAIFHHVGLAVDSIADASPDSEIVVNRTQGVSMAFVSLNGVRFELLEPLGENSPIAKSVSKGVKLLHVCYEVPDVDEALAECKAWGFHRISPVVPTPEFGNRRIAWVFSKQFGLFELVERSPDSPAGGGKTDA